MLRRFFPTEESEAEVEVEKVVDEEAIAEVPVQVVEPKEGALNLWYAS